MTKLNVIGVILLLFSSCGGLNQFIVTPVGQEPSGYSQRFIYSLPQTVVEVKVEFTKTTFIPGPYRQFTEKFLGMSQFISQEKSQWTITGVQVKGITEPDPAQYFSVNMIHGPFQAEAYIDLELKGLIINPMGMISENTILPGNQSVFPEIFDLSLKQNHKEKVDTLFKTVIKDTSFVKIPILRKQKEVKTLEQKAEEAANLIIKIRKRKLKLIDGEYGVFPEGQALETAIEELNKTEKEYIALFTGKIYTETFCKSFLVVPVGGNEKQVLMKFSLDKGILGSESAEGQEVSIEFIPQVGFPEAIKDNNIKSGNTLYYRIPETCLVRASIANEVLYEGRISVFQAGVVLPLPVKK